ncbi:RNA methyltransferase [Oscillatoria sp. CS-180]|uniref:TrmH family RNA methyltransferase n=1 Tax=Oscillatoria sp. CS-180 TaxID=3021720 RepID=UPI00232D4195|nr:RNA methyltransferase [Oscillatoria sp. CS-180]MDB9529840.1 RNA methyltransferase [Oscillatoria sp. CS-180]
MRSHQCPAARHPLKLCATLVQNPMNLGALCRTAEVFGLEQLVLPSLKWAEDQEFRKLAVSAHQWQPMTECSVDQLSHWMSQQQHQGMSIIALCRHNQAIPLPKFLFPKRSVLLLGRELTGIPEALIAQCNAVVEIPQYGQVDSLNVAVAAAIAIYAYLSQYGDMATE